MSPRQIGNKRSPVEFAVKPVDFGKLFLQVLTIAFRQAPHHVEFLYVPEVFGFDLFEDCVDRFLLGVADETASVHHHYVGRG